MWPLTVKSGAFFMAKKYKDKHFIVDGDAFKESELKEDLKDQFALDEEGIAAQRDDPHFSWDEREALLLGRNKDGISGTTKSQVNTQDLQNLIFDGASRVMAQQATGKVRAITKSDKGKNAYMNLALTKYVLPNANAQWGDLLVKDRLWNVYSRVYGSMPAMVDWRVDDDYVGPDMWLINPRCFFPEKGITLIDEMSRCFVDTYVSYEWLKSKASSKTWKNINLLCQKIKESGGSDKTHRDANHRTYTEKLFNSTQGTSQKKHNSQILLRSRYERNKWVTCAPDYEWLIVRDIENPHHNSQINVIMKHCFPLMDRIYGLGEFERGKTLAYAINSLVNLYLDGVKMSIFPPTIINPSGVVLSTLKREAGTRWFETKPNSIREHQVSPQGLNTFQSTYQFMKGALQSMGAMTDTSISSSDDPSMGKTPQALQMQEARMGARDNWDRFMMEKAIEKRNNLFVDLLANKQEKPIDLQLFGEEIKDIQRAYPDIADLIETSETGEYAQLTIKKEDVGKTKYRFFIDSGTTMKKEDAMENQTLERYMGLFMQAPPFAQQVIQTGKVQIGDKTVDFGEMMKRSLMTSGIQDWDKIITDTPQEQMMTGQPLQAAPSGVPQDPAQQEQLLMAQMQQMSQDTPTEEPFDPNSIQDPEIRQFAEMMMGGIQQ